MQIHRAPILLNSGVWYFNILSFEINFNALGVSEKKYTPKTVKYFKKNRLIEF